MSKQTVVELKNLKPYKGDFVYLTGNEGDVVKVEVDYQKGQSIRGRGIYLHITPVKREQCPGYMSEQHVMFSGLMMQLAPLARATPKTLEAMAAVIDPIAPFLAEQFTKEGKEAVIARVRALLAPAAFPAVCSDSAVQG